MKSFYANHISCSQDDDVLSIGLADDEFDPIDFVILSRFAEPDRSADQQIGLLVNETDLEFQHAITAIRLFGSQMVIHFTDTVAEELKTIFLQLNSFITSRSFKVPETLLS